MAIYHFEMKPVRRRDGRSATAAAAYWSASKIFDEATGLTIDRTRDRRVVHTEILLPAFCIDCDWARNRQALWNSAERAERRSDARVARAYEWALPHELSDEQRITLTREFAQRIADRYLVAVDASIYRAASTGNSRNFHAHLLTTTRVVECVGLGKKSTLELSSGDRTRAGLGSAIGELLLLRELWAADANAHLEQAGSDVRIDHRRLAAQGIERAPQRRRGVALTALLRRNQEATVGQRLHDEEFAADKPPAGVSVARDSS